jgi:hypothetical protein
MIYNYFNIPKNHFMKTKIGFLAFVALSTMVFVSCQKETSFEQGNTNASVGSLSVDATGNCLGAVVGGTYYKDTTIKASNYVDVSVEVDTVGTYTITSDTVNGYYFKASGTFNNIGTQVIRLAGGGKPLTPGTNLFTVSYNGTTCEFTVTVTAPAGGSAVFSVACTGATPVGVYKAGTALTSANTITLNVSVTTVGSWSVTTAPAVNGIIFAGSGTFSTTGAQTIILTATGTPTAAGTNNHTVTGATATCTFPVTVIPAAPPDYFPRTQNSNWSYEYDNDSDDSLLIYSQGTTVKAGNTYNIFWYNDGVSAVDTFGYYRRSVADYYEYGDMSYGILDNPYRGEFIFLKDNLAASATWDSSPFSGDYTDQMGVTGTITLRWHSTILQQNVTVAITSSTGVVSYTNVIEVKQEMQQMVGTTWELVAYFRNYYARDKGLIKQDLYDETNALLTSSEVRRLIVY